jgi:hypothetical protein
MLLMLLILPLAHDSPLRLPVVFAFGKDSISGAQRQVNF